MKIEFRVVQDGYYTHLEHRTLKNYWFSNGSYWSEWKKDSYYSYLGPDVASLAESAMHREIERLKQKERPRIILAQAEIETA